MAGDVMGRGPKIMSRAILKITHKARQIPNANKYQPSRSKNGTILAEERIDISDNDAGESHGSQRKREYVCRMIGDCQRQEATGAAPQSSPDEPIPFDLIATEQDAQGPQHSQKRYRPAELIDRGQHAVKRRVRPGFSGGSGANQGPQIADVQHEARQATHGSQSEKSPGPALPTRGSRHHEGEE
jgi:hypothetical protein